MNDVKTRENFVAGVWAYYRQHGRHDLPWRVPEANGLFDPYKILVSEFMLQQTQVLRVIPKYHAFLRQFPALPSLARARLGHVLVAWQGLGYNRRAKYLWQAAGIIRDRSNGLVPNDQAALEHLPGIGANTAGAIRAYAFNEPAIFIETNIRTAYIHHFFRRETDVPDGAIRALLEATLDRANPRQFYWALMDYGAHVKQTAGNAARASTTYAKQSRFHGSLRQIRGQVLRTLAEGPADVQALTTTLDDPRAARVLADLTAEGLIREDHGRYRLP